MKNRMMLLVAAGTLMIPGLSAPRSAEAGEVYAAPASQAPAEASPGNAAPGAEAAGAEAPVAEQYRRRTTTRRTYRTRPTHRTYRTRTYVAPRYYSSYHYYPRYYPPVVYSPPVVVYEEPVVMYEEPVVVEQAVVHSGQPVVYEAPQAVAAEDNELGIVGLVHFIGVNEGDTDLAFETIQGAGLLGVSAALRFALDQHWALEAGVGVMGSERDGVEQFSVPLSLSVLARLFPGSIVVPYGIAGLDVIFSQYDDPAVNYIENYTQFAGHLGFGAELNLGNFVISSDLRFLFMNARPEREIALNEGVSVRDDIQPQLTGYADADSMNTALQFQIGAGWRF